MLHAACCMLHGCTLHIESCRGVFVLGYRRWCSRRSTGWVRKRRRSAYATTTLQRRSHWASTRSYSLRVQVARTQEEISSYSSCSGVVAVSSRDIVGIDTLRTRLVAALGFGDATGRLPEPFAQYLIRDGTAAAGGTNRPYVDMRTSDKHPPRRESATRMQQKTEEAQPRSSRPASPHVRRLHRHRPPTESSRPSKPRSSSVRQAAHRAAAPVVLAKAKGIRLGSRPGEGTPSKRTLRRRALARARSNRTVAT